MPKADGLLTILPAEQHRPPVHLRRKIDQTEIDALELTPELLDLADRALDLGDVGRELGAYPNTSTVVRTAGSASASFTALRTTSTVRCSRSINISRRGIKAFASSIVKRCVAMLDM